MLVMFEQVSICTSYSVIAYCHRCYLHKYSGGLCVGLCTFEGFVCVYDCLPAM